MKMSTAHYTEVKNSIHLFVTEHAEACSAKRKELNTIAFMWLLYHKAVHIEIKGLLALYLHDTHIKTALMKIEQDLPLPK